MFDGVFLPALIDGSRHRFEDGEPNAEDYTNHNNNYIAFCWTAQVLCSQRVFKLSLAPGKMRDDGRISETICVATFLPVE